MKQECYAEDGIIRFKLRLRLEDFMLDDDRRRETLMKLRYLR